MRSIAIIPARGGSKRIPRKNIKSFLGKPIIAFSIEAALRSCLFDEVMVSTDDVEIAEVAQKYGAQVPFFRNPATSDDFATTADVLKEVISMYKMLGQSFEYGCCIYPTAPLVKVSSLKETFKLLVDNKYNSVFPVLKYSYPIWRSLKLEEGMSSMNWPEYLDTRTQDLPTAFHDAGQFYWFSIAKFLVKGKLYTDNSGAVELNELEVQDIDNETDWKLAELKFKLINSIE